MRLPRFRRNHIPAHWLQQQFGGGSKFWRSSKGEVVFEQPPGVEVPITEPPSPPSEPTEGGGVGVLEPGPWKPDPMDALSLAEVLAIARQYLMSPVSHGTVSAGPPKNTSDFSATINLNASITMASSISQRMVSDIPCPKMGWLSPVNFISMVSSLPWSSNIASPFLINRLSKTGTFKFRPQEIWPTSWDWNSP